MSTPVTTRITPGETARDKSEYIVSFYLGGKYQDSPPVPTEEGVYVEARPAMKVNTIS